jgi:hypothetical protein
MGLLDLFRRKSTTPTAIHPATPFTAIEVAKVTLANTALPELPHKSAVEALLTKPPSRWGREPQQAVAQPTKSVEACSRYHGQLVAGVNFHPVVAAIHLAFNDHRPLVLSPDMLWLLVAQGLANHVNANAQVLRSKFLKHSGKVTIAVRRDDFIKGSPENPWPEVFGEFSSRIREHLGAATYDLLAPRFSTTGAAESAAAEVVLLDAMQSFFSYEFHTMCGIPQIVLEGAPADWEVLAERTRGIGQFGLGWWTEALGPILEEFTAASRGRVNVRFWQSIYKLDGGSGGPYTTGWVTAFFPYLKDWQTGQASHKNPWLARGGKELKELLYPPAKSDPHRFGHGPTTEAFPSGLARAPFLWNYLDRSFEMEFLGGFVGVRQEADTLRLRPEIGWAVRDLALVRSLEAAEAAAVAEQRAAWENAKTNYRPTCSYCNGAGDCYCKRKGSTSSDHCARCGGSGKCHVCQARTEGEQSTS